MRMRRFLVAPLLLLFVWSGAAAAATVFETDVLSTYFTGSRTVDGGGLKEVDGSAPEAAVSWIISWTGTNWSYAYTYSGFGYDISHVTIDVSDPFASLESGLIVGNTVTVGGETQTPQFGDADILGSFKVDPPVGNEGELTISFLSTHAPMWGDMYMKDGQHYTVANFYWDAHSETDSITGYIPVPDTVVPIPATLLLMGSGLAGLVGIARWKRRT